MLDLKFVRNNLEAVEEGLKKRGLEVDLGEFTEAEQKRRELIFAVEQLKSQRNSVSQEIAAKKTGEGAEDLILKMRPR